MSTSSKWKLEIVPYMNDKEPSTYLMTVKIEGDTIQDMRTLHGQESILFFVAANGLVVLPNFDYIDESMLTQRNRSQANLSFMSLVQ